MQENKIFGTSTAGSKPIRRWGSRDRRPHNADIQKPSKLLAPPTQSWAAGNKAVAHS